MWMSSRSLITLLNMKKQAAYWIGPDRAVLKRYKMGARI